MPPRYSQEFAQGRPNVQLEVLASGHELTDVLDYMAPKVLEFLTRRLRPGSSADSLTALRPAGYTR